jgi:hypothetical protein
MRLAEGTFNPLVRAPDAGAAAAGPRSETAAQTAAAPAAATATASTPDSSERRPRGTGEGGGSRRPRGEGAVMGGDAPASLMRQFRERSGARSVRTAYRLPSETPAGAKPDAVEVRIGITDGQFTEVLSGLADGDVVVTGLLAEQSAGAPRSPQGGNPFGGGGGGGGGRPGSFGR